MQLTDTATISSADLERNRAWLSTADRHWSSGPITADEFARQAVGRVLLQDIASRSARRFDAFA
jgi:hypothetical protein